MFRSALNIASPSALNATTRDRPVVLLHDRSGRPRKPPTLQSDPRTMGYGGWRTPLTPTSTTESREVERSSCRWDLERPRQRPRPDHSASASRSPGRRTQAVLDRMMVAIADFDVVYDGEPETIRAGTDYVCGSHPIVVRHPDKFRPATQRAIPSRDPEAA